MNRIVAIINTGVSNAASIARACVRVGFEPRPVATPQEIEQAAAVVLPGVGSFSAGMAALRRSGLSEAIKDRVSAGRPTLAICLGMQLLAEGSEEAPGVKGLGLVPGVARRFPVGHRVPHLGWNRVSPDPGFSFAPGTAYFVHSYRFTVWDHLWSCARSEHAGEFVALASRGPVLACQFHPELSGAYGQSLLRLWCSRALEREKSTCC